MFGKVMTFVLATLGTLAATIGSQGCLFLYIDEVETPKSLIK